MAVEVVLLKQVDNLGQTGEVVAVSEGYARNFLLVFGYAKLATEKAKKEAANIKKQKEKEEKEQLDEAKKLAKKIAGMKFIIKKKTKDNKLFGSVSVSEIIKLLDEQGFKLTKNQVEIKEPIKEAGKYEIKIKIFKGVIEKIKLEVKSDEGKK